MDVPTLSPQMLVYRHIENHPGITVRKLCDTLQMTPNSVWMSVKRLRAAGRIRRLYIEGERRMCWELGEEPDYEEKQGNPRDGQPDQRTVSTWEKENIAQQSWLSSIMNG